MGSWWETTTTGGDVTYYTFNGRVVAYADTTGAVDYLFTDHLGSVTTTHGASGTLNNRYHPFGQPRDTLQVTDTDRGYTGQRRDHSTGLMHYQARYYDPALRRFTQPDTIIPNPLNPQDLNRYTYTRNNPVRYTDPTGHEAEAGGGGGCSTPYCLPPGSTFTVNAAGVTATTYSPAADEFMATVPYWTAYGCMPECVWIGQPPPSGNGLYVLTATVVDFVPIVGDVKGFAEAFTGEDVISGEPLSGWDRFLGLIFLSELRRADGR